MKNACLVQDPLTAGKLFLSCCQRSGEKVADFADHLKKLFKQAYPDEKLTSGILLQRFLTGLMSPVSQQILLRGQPTTFEQAIENVKEVEYALNSETEHTEPETKDNNVINKTHPMENQTLTIQLQQALDQANRGP